MTRFLTWVWLLVFASLILVIHPHSWTILLIPVVVIALALGFLGLALLDESDLHRTIEEDKKKRAMANKKK